MNAWRKELNDLLSAADSRRPPALRRSLTEKYLYAESVQSFLEAAESAGWSAAECRGWIELDRFAAEPPEGGLPDVSGPEAACCLSLLRRHRRDTAPSDGRSERMLIKAGEEGPDAYERICAALHASWAESLRNRRGIPAVSDIFFGGGEESC